MCRKYGLGVAVVFFLVMGAGCKKEAPSLGPGGIVPGNGVGTGVEREAVLGSGEESGAGGGEEAEAARVAEAANTPNPINDCGDQKEDCTAINGWEWGLCTDGVCRVLVCKEAYRLVDGSCVANSVTQCGVSERDCTKIEGWREGDCTKGECSVTACEPGYCLQDGKCKNQLHSVVACGESCEACDREQSCVQGYCVKTQCWEGCFQNGKCNDELCGKACLDCQSLEHVVKAHCVRGDDHHRCPGPHGFCHIEACVAGYHVAIDREMYDYFNSETEEDEEDEYSGTHVPTRCEPDAVEACGQRLGGDGRGWPFDCSQVIEGWGEGYCIAGECVPSACARGYVWDLIEGIPACVKEDPTKCGVISVDCTKLSGWVSGACVGGACVAESCAVGTHVEAGACVPDRLTACGAQPVDCTKLPGWADGACVQGRCEATKCKSPSPLCKGECTNFESDAAHCGGCGHSCNPNERCLQGTCTCPLTICEGACTDTQTDAKHCGQCGQSCGDGETCAVGSCKCGDSAGCKREESCRDGECYELQNSRYDCGAVGARCENHENCEGGRCVVSQEYTLCDGKYVYEEQIDKRGVCQCGQNPPCEDKCCGGECVTFYKLDWEEAGNPNHCDSCGDKCEEGKTCCRGDEAGSNYCVDLQNSTESCGECNHYCRDDLYCHKGKCVCGEKGKTCAKGEICCGEACVNPKRDANHCGGCGGECGVGEKCRDGMCWCGSRPGNSSYSSSGSSPVCEEEETCVNGKCR